MVYAPYGRAGIYLLQEFCRRIGIAANDAGMRDLIRALRALPPGHPWKDCFVSPPIFSKRRPLPMLSCIPRTGHTLSRNCSTSSRTQG